MVRKMQKEYCGKTYGKEYDLLGILIGACIGVFVGKLLFDKAYINLSVACVFAFLARKTPSKILLEKRKRDLRMQFCDYLDSVSASFSAGKNSYDSFVSAAEDIASLYKENSPMVYESRLVAEGLENGESLAGVLRRMSEHTQCPDVSSFCEVFSVCNSIGGNLKEIADDTRMTLTEKISVETEIESILSGPKNELRIMLIMPFLVVMSIRALTPDLLVSDSVSITVNAVALAVFVASYIIGRRITDIEV